LSLEHGLGPAVAHLLFPIRPHGPAIVMPDHGSRTEPEFPASLPRSPTNIHVVASLPELRIKSIDDLQPTPAESHVTARNVLCFAIGKEHVGRTSRRVGDTIRSVSVIRDWYIRAPDACVIFFEECGGEICHPIRIAAGMIINICDSLSCRSLRSHIWSYA